MRQIANRQDLDSFSIAKRAAFDQLIVTAKEKIEEKLISIEVCLKQCTNIYRVCCNIGSLIANVNDRLRELYDKMGTIANSFDGITTLTTSIDGKILSLENQVFAFEKEKEKILRRARNLRGLVSPRLDSLGVHKRECMDMLAKPTPVDTQEKELFAHLLSGLASVLNTFKSGCDTYLKLLQKAYLKILKMTKLE